MRGRSKNNLRLFSNFFRILHLFFSGLGHLDSIIDNDEHSRVFLFFSNFLKMNVDTALGLFDFRIKLGGIIGVRSLQIQEEMTLILHELKSIFSS